MTNLELIEKALNIANQKGAFTIDDAYNVKIALTSISLELNRLSKVESDVNMQKAARKESTDEEKLTSNKPI